MDSVIVKIEFEQEVRRSRFLLKDLNYDLLAEKAIEMFPEIEGERFCFSYTDEEGDRVILDSSDELSELVDHQSKKLNLGYCVLKLNIDQGKRSFRQKSTQKPVTIGFVTLPDYHSLLFGSQFDKENDPNQENPLELNRNFCSNFQTPQSNINCGFRNWIPKNSDNSTSTLFNKNNTTTTTTSTTSSTNTKSSNEEKLSEEQKLIILSHMGFNEPETNITILRLNDGELESTISYLIRERERMFSSLN